MNEKKNTHIIFGTGPVGLAVMAELVTRGGGVRMVNRSGKANVPPQVEVIAGDAGDPVFTRAICKGASVVYNATNAPYTQWPELFPRLQAGVLAGASANGAKLVVMENVYMYGPTGGKLLTEDLPLPYAATTRKGRTRARMSEELMEANAKGTVRVAIGRASDFFGPGVHDSSAGERLFIPALHGKSIQLIGNPDLPHTYTYVPDIGKGLVILGEREEAIGQAWHLPGPPTGTTRAFIQQVCKEADTTPHLQPAPGWLLKGMGLFNPLMRELAEMAYEFEEPFIVDHTRFARAFGDIATPMPEAIRASVEWYRLHRPAK